MIGGPLEMGTWDFDPATERVVFDERGMSLSNLSSVDVSLSVACSTIHPRDRDGVRRRIEAAVDPMGEGAYEASYRLVDERGRVTHSVRSVGRAVFRADAAAAAGRTGERVLGVVMDVTERREREARLQQALDIGRAAAFAWFPQQDRVEYDDRVGSIYGLDPAESSSDDFNLAAALERLIHPEDRDRYARDVEASLDPGGSRLLDSEFRTLPHEGRIEHILVRGRVEFEGEPPEAHRVIGLVSNVTERREQERAVRQSERELRALADNTPDVITRFDRELRHVFINAAVTKATGRPRSDFLGRRPEEVGMPPELVADWIERLQATFDTGEPRSYEFSHETPDGERWYEASLVPEFVDGGVASVLTVTRDATQRRQMEAQMRASMREAERANAAKGHFLAVLSHELRMPLTPVLAAAGELARREDLPADVRADLAMIRRNVELEARLMDDLLDLTRVTRGKLQLNLTALDAHETIRRVAEMVAAEAEGKKVMLTLDLAAGWPIVTADAARLQQILWNLFKNAVKFTASGGSVTVRTHDAGPAAEPGGGRAARFGVTVVDTGVGIEAETLPRIFDAFEQGGAETTRQFGGLGLGLAISKVLVDLHGGTISADSAGPGRGATFAIEVPTADSVAPKASEGDGPASRDAIRLLLVEDHADTARVMVRLLRRRGLVVKTADTVAGGLRTVTSEPFDVIVSDLGLPDGSGHDLLRQARAAGVTAPAIVLSGFGSERDIEHSRAAGFVHHLTKPTDLDQLVEVVRRVGAGAVDPSIAEGAASD